MGRLAMVHLRVDDADRAMRFFGDVFGWEGERVVFDEHVSYYTINTDMTIRILDDPDAPAVVPNYASDDVAATMTAVAAAGGTVTESEAQPDGGGWARGFDNQGLPLLWFRPGRTHVHAAPTRTPTGEVGLVFIRADRSLAESFYAPAFGWEFASRRGSFYTDTVERVGVFDEAAAFDTEVAADVTLYFNVDALAPALARVAELGGTPGEVAHDMGPYYTAVCTDDQGTRFGVMSLAQD
jgi:predicted enzyme related to lactoylglutathione lyase